MEETPRSTHHRHSIAISSLQHLLILDRSARRTDVRHSTPLRPVHIIRERKERIRCQRHALPLRHPFLSLRHRQEGGNLFEQRRPRTVLHAIGLFELHLATDKLVNGVGFVRALHTGFEVQREYTRMKARPKVIGLAARETRAVDAGLLTGAQADNHAIVRVADAVGLGVLESNGGDDEVTKGIGRERRGCGDNVAETLGIDLGVVATLLQMEAVDLARFRGGRHVSRVHLR